MISALSSGVTILLNQTYMSVGEMAKPRILFVVSQPDHRCLHLRHLRTQPRLPKGDLLLHAGDLTQWGTFGELQAHLTWLAQQPHKHKVVIAGNHDLILDPDFQWHYPEKWKQALGSASTSREDRSKVADDLEWGDIAYLQNTSTSIAFGNDGRTINIFGSPLTPQ